MAYNEISLTPEKILTAIHQQLNIQFFGTQKVESKQMFTRLNEGRALPFLQISSAEQGEIIGHLALDHSEFVGRLNFSQFRDCLAAHLNHVARKLNNKEGLNVFTEEQTGALLFNLPGIIQTEEQINVMVCGVEQMKPGHILIKLMFLDPVQFQQAAGLET